MNPCDSEVVLAEWMAQQLRRQNDSDSGGAERSTRDSAQIAAELEARLRDPCEITVPVQSHAP